MQILANWVDAMEQPLDECNLRTHGRVVMNLSRHLGNALDGTRCEVYAESMQLQIEQNLCYPDVFVTCDPRDLTTERVFVAPTLVVEVLSPSTGTTVA